MSLIDTIGWKATGLRNRIVDRWWERKLGIDTKGFKDVNQPDANRYATFAYSSIMKIIDHLDPRPDDVFVDIGSGKGRVVCCAAMRPAKRVIGIDIDRELCDIAQSNARRMRGRVAHIDIVNTGAQQFDYGDCNKFFLFNSFGPTTLKQVLQAISDSLANKPRSIDFAYVNPFHDQLLEDSGFLERCDQWQRRSWSGLKFNVSFWSVRNRGA